MGLLMHSELATWLRKHLADDAQDAPTLAAHFRDAHNTLCQLHSAMSFRLDFTKATELELALWRISGAYFRKLDDQRKASE